MDKCKYLFLWNAPVACNKRPIVVNSTNSREIQWEVIWEGDWPIGWEIKKTPLARHSIHGGYQQLQYCWVQIDTTRGLRLRGRLDTTEDEEEDRQDESQCPQQTAPASCLPGSLCEYQPQTETDDLTNILQLIGVTFVITTIVWAAVFKNGIKFSSTELGIDFNWHPILMTISLLFLYGNGRLPSTRLLCNS